MGGGGGQVETTSYPKVVENTGMDQEQWEPQCCKVVRGFPAPLSRVGPFHPPTTPTCALLPSATASSRDKVLLHLHRVVHQLRMGMVGSGT